MDPRIISSVISALASFVGASLNYKSTSKTNAANADINQSMLNYNASQVEQARAYNSPANQMRLLTQAGLNPNLVAGSISGVSSDVARAPDPLYMQRNNFDAMASGLSGASNAYLNSLYSSRSLDIQQQDADTRSKVGDSTIDVNGAVVVNLGSRTDLNKETVNKIRAECNVLAREIDKINSEIAVNEARIKSLDADTMLSNLKSDWQRIHNSYADAQHDADLIKALEEIHNIAAQSDRLEILNNISLKDLQLYRDTYQLRIQGYEMDNVYKACQIGVETQKQYKLIDEIAGIRLQNGILSFSYDFEDRLHQDLEDKMQSNNPIKRASAQHAYKRHHGYYDNNGDIRRYKGAIGLLGGTSQSIGDAMQLFRLLIK